VVVVLVGLAEVKDNMTAQATLATWLAVVVVVELE
jgi:hypothetical protein